MKERFAGLFKSIIKGELLIRLNIGKYFIHICYCFAMAGVIILLSLLIDRRIGRIVKNERILSDQQTEMVLQEYELARFTRRTEVAVRLQQMKSGLKEPTKPAYRIYGE